MFCARCGGAVEAHDRVCANCGADLTVSGSVRLTDPRLAEGPAGVDPDPTQVLGAGAGAAAGAAPVDPWSVPPAGDASGWQPEASGPRQEPVPAPPPVHLQEEPEPVGAEAGRREWPLPVPVMVAVGVGTLAGLGLLSYWLLNLDDALPEVVATPTATVTVTSPAPTPTRSTAAPTPSFTWPSPVWTPTPTTGTPTTTVGVLPPGVPADASQCAGDVWRNANASCGFALAVANNVNRGMSGSTSFPAQSPTTGQVYQVTCVRGEVITCAGSGQWRIWIAPA